MSNDAAETYQRVNEGGRTFSHWANAALIQDSKFCPDGGSPGEIAEVLDNPRYIDLRGRFLRTPDIAEYQKLVRSIPIQTALSYTRTLMRPIYTDFTETSENREFSRISAKFYFHLFIQESIYVSYDLFNNTTVIIQKTDKKLQPQIEVIKKKKFDLWIKMTDTEYDDDCEFLHIDTSIIIKVPKGREKMAHVRWGADYQNNFVNWFNIGVTQLTMEEFLKQSCKMLGTRLSVTTDTSSSNEYRKTAAMLETMTTIIHRNFGDRVDLEPIELMTGQDLDALRDTIYHYLDRLKYEYGRVSNTNPKGERLTSGENYKDISAIANRQKETLEQLIEFAYQAEEMGGIHLEFAVSGIPEKEAIFTVSHMAQNPNSEKEYFGQIEGTEERRPLGQAGRRTVTRGAKSTGKKR